MSNKQKGFSVISIIALVAVLAMSGFVGYYVWNKNKQAKATTKSSPTASDAAKPSATISPTPTFAAPKVPEGYVLYENTNPKFSFVYPKEWDSHKESSNTKGVKIVTEDVDKDLKWFSVMQNSTYKYDSKSKAWVFNPDTGYKPPVLWKDDTKTVYDMTEGEGGGFINRVAFIYSNKIYFITAPGMNGCEGPNGCYDDNKYVSIKSSDYLEQIAKSITL